MIEHCRECHPELHRAQCSLAGCVVALEAELDDLERTDPDVRAAAESYYRMVERITGRIVTAFDVPSEMVGLPDDGRRPDPRECQCPEPNPDCQHPTCPRWPQPGHLAGGTQ